MRVPLGERSGWTKVTGPLGRGVLLWLGRGWEGVGGFGAVVTVVLTLISVYMTFDSYDDSSSGSAITTTGRVTNACADDLSVAMVNRTSACSGIAVGVRTISSTAIGIALPTYNRNVVTLPTLRIPTMGISNSGNTCTFSRRGCTNAVAIGNTRGGCAIALRNALGSGALAVGCSIRCNGVPVPVVNGFIYAGWRSYFEVDFSVVQ